MCSKSFAKRYPHLSPTAQTSWNAVHKRMRRSVNNSKLKSTTYHYYKRNKQNDARICQKETQQLQLTSFPFLVVSLEISIKVSWLKSIRGPGSCYFIETKASHKSSLYWLKWTVYHLSQWIIIYSYLIPIKILKALSKHLSLFSVKRPGEIHVHRSIIMLKY